MNKKIKWSTGILFLLTLMLNLGCNKEKISGDIEKDDVLNMTGSNIRMFNISGMDISLIINNIVLTKPYEGGQGDIEASELGQKIFPEGLWKNQTAFTIPSLLLDKSGRSFISIPGYFPGTILEQNKIRKFADTVLQNNPMEPKDYYLLPSAKLITFTRNSSPPANPQNFKLRIVNLGDAQSEFGLVGPVSVTYADGSLVDTKLNNIGMGTSSDYVELPYGAYQFKVFIGTTDGNIDYQKQLCTDDLIPAYNPCQPATVMPQEGFMPAVTTFKPGGVYTLMVLPSGFSYENNCTFIRESHYANIYQLVTDLDPGINFSYARINAINTIPGKKITLAVDGQLIGGALEYIGSQFIAKALPAEYFTFIQGEHTIAAMDETGSVIAETTIQLYPFDNYTIWVHSDIDGKGKLIFTSNDMTNTMYKTGEIPAAPPDDGTNGEIRRSRNRYAWQSRFMNFCNAQPSITFTNNGQLFLPEYFYPDTLRFQQAYTQLQPGWVPPRNGSVIYRILNISLYNADGTPQRVGSNDEAPVFPLKIWVNNSAQGDAVQIPGSMLTNITPITSANTFVANNMMYSSGNARPPAENGVYSIALVGGQSGADAKIIAIKHNK